MRSSDFVEGMTAVSESRRQLLSIGVFFIVAVAAILLYATGLMSNWLDIFPVIFLLFGLWMVALASMRQESRGKYESTPFATLEGGVLLIAVGGAWLLWPLNWLYAVAVLLFVLGAIAIVAAMRRKTP